MINVKQIEIKTKSVIFEISNFEGVVWDYTIHTGQIEIALADIDYVLNELLHYDDILIIVGDRQFYFKKSYYDYRLTEKEIRGFRCQPFAHQVDAINFGLKDIHPKWLLLDSMG